jgi:hypothetical protein
MSKSEFGEFGGVDGNPTNDKLAVGLLRPQPEQSSDAIMRTKRTHIVIPEQLVVQIDRVVGKRGRSSFLAQAAERELMRLRQIKALKAATGAWKDEDHPELKQGAAAWVAKLRREDERRYRRMNERR